ncbi:MAG: hypothetical protein KDA53_08600 [Hyphomonas sp.]|nr:hypothetical protein [Hyphomonas sp.]
MRSRALKVLTGWRARRLAEGGGLFVRAGAAFRLYRFPDERGACCGRVPAHVVARLRPLCALVPHRGDPDRLVTVREAPARHLLPTVVPDMEDARPMSLREAWEAPEMADATRLRAAAARFEADYQLSVQSAGPVYPVSLIEGTRARLMALDEQLGPGTMLQAEALLIDRLTPAAYRHVFRAGPEEAYAVAAMLAAAYGLALQDQEAGSAFASA